MALALSVKTAPGSQQPALKGAVSPQTTATVTPSAVDTVRTQFLSEHGTNRAAILLVSSAPLNSFSWSSDRPGKRGCWWCRGWCFLAEGRVEGSVWDPGNWGCEQGQSWKCLQPVMDGKSFRNGEEKFRVRGGNEGLGFDSCALTGSVPRVATGDVFFPGLFLHSKEQKALYRWGGSKARTLVAGTAPRMAQPGLIPAWHCPHPAPVRTQHFPVQSSSVAITLLLAAEPAANTSFPNQTSIPWELGWLSAFPVGFP